MQPIVDVLRQAVGQDAPAQAALDLLVAHNLPSGIPSGRTASFHERIKFLLEGRETLHAGLSRPVDKQHLESQSLCILAVGAPNYVGVLVETWADQNAPKAARNGAMVLLAAIATKGEQGRQAIRDAAPAIFSPVLNSFSERGKEGVKVLSALGGVATPILPQLVAILEQQSTPRPPRYVAQAERETIASYEGLFATVMHVAKGSPAVMTELFQRFPQDFARACAFDFSPEPSRQQERFGFTLDTLSQADRRTWVTSAVQLLIDRPWSTQLERESKPLVQLLAAVIKPADTELADSMKLLGQMIVRDRYGLADPALAVLEKWSVESGDEVRKQRRSLFSWLNRSVFFPLRAQKANPYGTHCSWFPEEIK